MTTSGIAVDLTCNEFERSLRCLKYGIFDVQQQLHRSIFRVDHTVAQGLRPVPGWIRENFINSNPFVSTTRHWLCFIPSSNGLLRGPKSAVVSIQVMLQLWRFSALGILLALFSLVFGEQTAQQVLSDKAKVSNDSLLWGPYRPNLYFGVRPRIPKSLMTGLIWAKVDSFQGVQNSM